MNLKVKFKPAITLTVIQTSLHTEGRLIDSQPAMQ